MFKHSFKENVTLQRTGSVEIPLEDDPDIFAILMEIAHVTRFQRNIGVTTLARLALLVDKYFAFKSTVDFADLWMEKLDLVDYEPWILGNLRKMLNISWVFRRPREFALATRVAILAGMTEENMDVVLPLRVCGK